MLKKSPDRAQGHTARAARTAARQSLALVPEVRTTRIAPPVPQGLEASVAQAWEAFWQTDFSRVINWERDHEALTRLFEMYSLRRKLLAACEEVLLVGSQGQTVLNPALRHLATIDGLILQHERQFGFTPQSAGALGLTLTGLRKSLDERNREANERAAAARKKA